MKRLRIAGTPPLLPPLPRYLGQGRGGWIGSYIACMCFFLSRAHSNAEMGALKWVFNGRVRAFLPRMTLPLGALITARGHPRARRSPSEPGISGYERVSSQAGSRKLGIFWLCFDEAASFSEREAAAAAGFRFGRPPCPTHLPPPAVAPVAGQNQSAAEDRVSEGVLSPSPFSLSSAAVEARTFFAGSSRRR